MRSTTKNKKNEQGEIMKYSKLIFENEADVEFKFVESFLTKILGYSKNHIKWKPSIKIPSGRREIVNYPDTVVYGDDGKPLFVLDAKDPTELLEDWYHQIDSYAFTLKVKYGVLTNGRQLVVRGYFEGNERRTIFSESLSKIENDFSDLQKLLSYKKINDSEEFPKLRPINKDYEKKTSTIKDYRRTFREIHTKIRSSEKLDPGNSFDEFSKLLFIKIINEKDKDDSLTREKVKVYEPTNYEELKISSTKNNTQLNAIEKRKMNFINEWFQRKVKEYYPEIFNDNELITVSSDTVFNVLETLDKEFTLHDSTEDIKGRAFEEFLPSQLRGKGLGQYFTPRPIVEFMVNLADIKMNETVLDFSCGSGGFLIKAFEVKKKYIDSLPDDVISSLNTTREDLFEKAKQQIYGIDAEPRAVRTAKMNMVLWGDGKQIVRGNGLDIRDYDNNLYPIQDFDENNPDETGCDVILANPPFGSDEKDPEILNRYSLGSKDRTVSSQKTEILFIERAANLLKPSGKLLIVLPEGIFSNPTSQNIRNLILKEFEIKGIFKLPKHTFAMSGVDTINTVVLYAQKNELEKSKKIKNMLSKMSESEVINTIKKTYDKPIFFGEANNVGFKPNGKLFNTKTDLEELLNAFQNQKYESYKLTDPEEYAEKMFSDAVKPEIWKENICKYMWVKTSETMERLDPTAYFFFKETEDILPTLRPLNNKLENGKNALTIYSRKLTEKELEENVEKTYKYAKIEKNIEGKIESYEERDPDSILVMSTKPKIIKSGDLVYNPYRINTGSICYVDDNFHNALVSPAYVIFRSAQYDSEYLLHLFKTPFYKYYIQVLSSGSVRDNFTSDALKQIRVPDISLSQQKETIMKMKRHLNIIQESYANIDLNIEKMSRNLLNNVLF